MQPVVSQSPDSWGVANVEVSCGIWKGVFQWQFYKGELRQFGEQVQKLYRTLNGEAVLEPMEPNLTLKLTGDGQGHIEVEGKAEPEFHADTYLVFHFTLDQTELASVGPALVAADPV